MLSNRRRDERGQATLMTLAALVTVAAFTLTTLHYGLQYRDQIQLQRAADTAATSGALWSARSLNLIAGMNEGILVFLTVFLVALLIWVLLELCATTVYCSALFAALDEPLRKVMKYAWDAAVNLSKLERLVVKAAPLMIAAQNVATARANGAPFAMPYPYKPEGKGASHDALSTISLHTKSGGFQAVINKALDKVPPELQRLFENPLAQSLIEEQQGGSSEDSNDQEGDNQKKKENKKELPDPLRLDDDFRPRMKCGALVWNSASLAPSAVATAQARPFLPDTAFGDEDLWKMNWRAKLVPVDFHRDIGSLLGRTLPARD